MILSSGSAFHSKFIKTRGKSSIIHCFTVWNNWLVFDAIEQHSTIQWENGQCERFIQALLGMLRTMADSQKSNWKSHVNQMTFACSSTRNDATGFSLFELLFGWKPRLPIDITFGEPETIVAKSYPEYLN